MAQDKPRPPTREELAQFLPTGRVLRAFEQLFDAVPADINDAENTAATAYAAAIEALSELAEVLALVGPVVLGPAVREPVALAETVEHVALAPAPEALDREAPYGEFYATNAGIIVSVAVVDTAYEVTSGMTAGLTNLVNFGGGRYLEVLRNGPYEVVWSMSVVGATPTDEIEGGFMVDGVAQAKGTSHGGGLATPDIITASAFVSLNPGQQVSLYVSNHTAARDIDVEHASLTLKRINPWPSQ